MPGSAGESGGESLQVACFGVGEQRYALDIMRIKEIINPRPLTAVPGAPAFIEGMIELRGQYIAVIDARRRLGLPQAPPDRHSKIIVVLYREQHLGLMVDWVSDVRRVATAAIGPVPEAARGVGTRQISGVLRADDGEAILVMALDRMLSDDERSELDDLAG
ncbi:MAG: chemotaxis protein CheW [Myxococcota bacterium]